MATALRCEGIDFVERCTTPHRTTNGRRDTANNQYQQLESSDTIPIHTP